MFRNPRENRSREVDDKIAPSIGRPPSPHNLSDPNLPALPLVPRFKNIMPSKTTPVASTPTKNATPASKGNKINAKTVKGKQEKGNGNIMAFFRKVAEANESLFIDDSFGRKSSAASIALPGLLQDESMLQTEDGSDDEARYNETGISNKRQKRSHSPQDNSMADGDGERPQVMAAGASIGAEDGDKLEKGSLSRSNGTDTAKKPRRAGPFIDDSDSEDDMPLPTDDDDAAPPLAAETMYDSPAPEIQDEIAAIKQELVDEDEIVQEYPPHLSRQGTSYAEQDGFADYENAEDFDDEYAEGEEFSERRWAKEQRRLEMLEGGLDEEANDEEFQDDYDLSSVKEETLDDVPPNGIPACPICSSSLAGITSQEASVHVNNCLDGNPTPLPTVAKTEDSAVVVKSEEAPPSAKFKRPARAPKPGQLNPFTLGTSEIGSSAFSKLMSGNNEEAAWASAAAEQNASRGKPAYQRTCPFYKILPGFYICVDAFRYGAVEGCNAYFLSHFHSDHYIGLTASWCHGPIYCSRVTANLVRQQLRVDPKYVVDLEWEQKTEVPGTKGVFVTMIPANHCPGSSLYLFEKVITSSSSSTNSKQSRMQRVLHCGDFRACPAHVEHPLLKPEVVDAVTGKTKKQKIDVCYLDTTYLNPKYAFPSQEDVIQACADMCVSLNKVRPDESDGWETMKRERAGAAMAKFVRKDSKDEDDGTLPESGKSKPVKDDYETNRGPLLVVVGTYSIGKERICLGIAKALKSKVYAPPGKQRICAALEDPELNALLTKDPYEAQVHMTPLFEIRAETLGDYLNDYKDRFTRCVGFRPSGWNYRPPGSRFTESPAVSTVLYSDNWKSAYGMKDLVPQRGSTRLASCFGVPYSEHSSFRELSLFCCALHIDRIVPTVNVGSKKSRETMKRWIDRWAQEKAKNGFYQVVRNEEGGEKQKGAWYAGKGTWALRTSISDLSATNT